MAHIILAIYDFFKRYPAAGWAIFVVISALLVLSFTRLSYEEDISAFLPLDEKNQTSLSVYQDISGANKIFAIISATSEGEQDPESLTEGVETFASYIEENDSIQAIGNIMKQVDMEKFLEISDFVYENIPYFIQDSDYRRIDSLLNQPDYIKEKLLDDKQMLLFPSSNMISANISRDPLDLFSPILGRLQQAGMSINFDTYDGYILSPDGTRAIIIMDSSYGAQESQDNARLVHLLEDAKKAVEINNANLDVHIIGGPVIAVGNANRIKADSIVAISIAGALILALLIYVFRNARNILLILVSVGWGWIFAMGMIALYYDSVSVIVIGIVSVILGIALNYPLHLIDHLKDSSKPRSALREIVTPLVIGNVTTVGAFLCLLPLNSPALHDLGLFSSLLLVGTIIFVLVFLPHAVKIKRNNQKEIDPKLITWLAGLKLENSKIIVWSVLALTVVFAVFSFKTEFDSDIRNINYMTPSQKEDMAYFQSLITPKEDVEDLFVVSFGDTWNDAINENASINQSVDSIVNSGMAWRSNEAVNFFVSKEIQEEKLTKWREFLTSHNEALTKELYLNARESGFSEYAFEPFSDILNTEYLPEDFEYFQPFISTVFSGSISNNNTSGRPAIVQTLFVPKENVAEVKEKLEHRHEFGGLVFDVKSMNGSIANSLSDDFNYIGFACGFIVFAFLWISFGRIELAVISFLPMAFSWVWILGIMGMLGLKFNIVNIILATFIFGQGDDYTIFITEGLQYELAYRKKILTSYKNSIVISALIMFIGIGTLLFAKHPAMRSLGEVTVVGMLSVVLMAYMFPPLIFNWLVQKNGKLRLHPITVGTIWNSLFRNRKRFTTDKFEEALYIAYGRYLYKGREIEVEAKRRFRELSLKKTEIVSLSGNSSIFVIDHSGMGELVMLLASYNKDLNIYCKIDSPSGEEILKACLYEFPASVTIIDNETDITEMMGMKLIETDKDTVFSTR